MAKIVRSNTKLNKDVKVAESELDGIEDGATADRTEEDTDTLGIAASLQTTAYTKTEDEFKAALPTIVV